MHLCATPSVCGDGPRSHWRSSYHLRALLVVPNECVGYALVMAPEEGKTFVARSKAAEAGASARRRSSRSAATGQFVQDADALRKNPRGERNVGRDGGQVPSARKLAASPTSREVNRRGRSAAADDPLAPERTRWLADVVGGSTALARMLGVSASQTTRWASGQERPGVVSAPLLIDLEHVFARIRLVWAEPAATTWLTSANAHLLGARPVDVLRLQGPGPVLEALDAATWGGAA